MDASLRVVGPTLDRIAGDRVGPVARAFFRRDYLDAHLLVEVAIASTLVALTAMLLFFTARLYLGAAGSIALALLFAFGTSAWSTASRALWQHAPAMLMLTAALLSALARGDSSRAHPVDRGAPRACVLHAAHYGDRLGARRRVRLAASPAPVPEVAPRGRHRSGAVSGLQSCHLSPASAIVFHASAFPRAHAGEFRKNPQRFRGHGDEPIARLVHFFAVSRVFYRRHLDAP